jgi:Domain of unknown function (DUF4417)
MLTPLPLVETVSKRRLRREQRLWHDATQHSSLLGCMNCPERNVCGGLHIAASAFWCLDHCCGHPESCDTVCRDNPDYVNRVREIGGFDLKTIPRAPILSAPHLPKVIPWLDHGGQREEPLMAEAICLSLYAMLNRRTGTTKFDTRDALNNAFKVSSDTTIILTGIAIDRPLERWWSLGERRRGIIQALRHLGVALVTTPNYSLFTDQPRWDNLHSMKRIALVWQEFIDEGLPAALHVNARTDTDWQRWIDFIGERPEVTHIAYEFGTGAGWASRKQWHAEQLVDLAQVVGRPIHLIVRGGLNILSILDSAFPQMSIMETSIFIKTMKRQRATLETPNSIGWIPAPTGKGELLDELMNLNFRTMSARLENTAS